MSVLREEDKWQISKARAQLKADGKLGEHTSRALLLIIDSLKGRLETLLNHTPKLEKKPKVTLTEES